MRINIVGKNFTVSDAIEARLEKKLNKLDRYFYKEVEAQVRLGLERGARNIAEITLSFGGGMLRAEEVADDMYKAIDRCTEKVERQIRRYRTKLEKRWFKEGSFAEAPEYFDEAPDDEEEEHNLVRTKTFPIKPMHVEDAIAQMQMLGHTFFVFMNMETESICVVYMRKDGNYGMLQPEYA